MLQRLWQPSLSDVGPPIWVWRSIKVEDKEVNGETKAEENGEDKASLINLDVWMHVFPKGIIFILRKCYKILRRFQTLNVLLVDRSASPSKNEKGWDAHYNAKPCGLMFILKFPVGTNIASLVVGTCHLECSFSQDASGKWKVYRDITSNKTDNVFFLWLLQSWLSTAGGAGNPSKWPKRFGKLEFGHWYENISSRRQQLAFSSLGHEGKK